MNRERFEEMALRWLDGRPEDGDREALQEALRESAERRREFVALANLDAGLREHGARREADAWLAASSSGDSPAKFSAMGFTNDGAASRGRRWGRRALVAAAAVALLLLGAASMWFRGERDEAEAMGRGFAVLTRAVDVDWGQGPSYRSGEVLPAGELSLESGLVQIEFFSGATVVLEGPGTLDIRSASEAYCARGRLRASVPPAARGFVVETPEGRLVDLGTEFGLAVGGGGDQEVHVFDGMVEWHDEGGVRAIDGGEALAGAAMTAARGADFVGSADLGDRLALSNDSEYERWRAHSRELRRDPRLLAYFPMDRAGNWQRRLLNEAPTGPEVDAAIVGANRVEGRWEGVGKGALEFTPTGSRARLVIPGEFTSLTFTCWARIDSLDRQYNALYMTDNLQVGEVHWQFHEDGRILFVLRVREDGERRNLMSWSPKVWDLSQSGRWMHLAAVFDEPAQEVRHYVDGELVLADPIPPSHEIHETRLGSGEIGNWGLPNRPENPWFAIRNLNGRIDEFAIFSDAVSSAEIAELYRAGNPR